MISIKFKYAIVTALVALTGLSCEHYENQYNFSQQGQASYYHRSLHGNPTKSGEKYDTTALTAAHPFLPLNTNIKVTNLDNQNSVKLRVNDRGPYAKKRILDVSAAAADKLGFRDEGHTEVKIQARLEQKLLDSLQQKYNF